MADWRIPGGPSPRDARGLERWDTCCMRTLVMTGGTRGLGRAVVDRVLALPDWRIILFARDVNPLTDLAPAVASRVEVVAADLADLRSVQRACGDVRSRLGGSEIAALALNAGLQSWRTDPVSADGFELHFAVNHLGHVLIADQLAPHVARGGHRTHDQRIA